MSGEPSSLNYHDSPPSEGEIGLPELARSWEEYVDNVLWHETSQSIAEFRRIWQAAVALVAREAVDEIDEPAYNQIQAELLALVEGYETALRTPVKQAETTFGFLIDDMSKALRHEMKNLMNRILPILQLRTRDPEFVREYFLAHTADDVLRLAHITQEEWRGQLGQAIAQEDKLTTYHLHTLEKRGLRLRTLDVQLQEAFEDERGSAQTQLEILLGNEQTPGFQQLILPRERYLLFYIQELLRNALYFLRDQPDGLVRITFSKDPGGGYTISILDNGPGIPEQRIQEVLQGGALATTKEHGTGIGVSVGSRILKALTGTTVEIEKRPVGTGANFILHVPAIPAVRTAE